MSYYPATQEQSAKLMEIHTAVEVATEKYLRPTSFWKKLFDTEAKKAKREQHVEAISVRKMLNIIYRVAHDGITDALWTEWESHDIDYSYKDDSLTGMVFNSVIAINRVKECDIMKEIINSRIEFLAAKSKADIAEHLDLVKTTLNKG